MRSIIRRNPSPLGDGGGVVGHVAQVARSTPSCRVLTQAAMGLGDGREAFDPVPVAVDDRRDKTVTRPGKRRSFIGPASGHEGQ
jgi:hypothetical protein